MSGSRSARRVRSAGVRHKRRTAPASTPAPPSPHTPHDPLQVVGRSTTSFTPRPPPPRKPHPKRATSARAGRRRRRRRKPRSRPTSSAASRSTSTADFESIRVEMTTPTPTQWLPFHLRGQPLSELLETPENVDEFQPSRFYVEWPEEARVERPSRSSSATWASRHARNEAAMLALLDPEAEGAPAGRGKRRKFPKRLQTHKHNFLPSHTHRDKVLARGSGSVPVASESIVAAAGSVMASRPLCQADLIALAGNRNTQAAYRALLTKLSVPEFDATRGPAPGYYHPAPDAVISKAPAYSFASPRFVAHSKRPPPQQPPEPPEQPEPHKDVVESELKGAAFPRAPRFGPDDPRSETVPGPGAYAPVVRSRTPSALFSTTPRFRTKHKQSGSGNLISIDQTPGTMAHRLSKASMNKQRFPTAPRFPGDKVGPPPISNMSSLVPRPEDLQLLKQRRRPRTAGSIRFASFHDLEQVEDTAATARRPATARVRPSPPAGRPSLPRSRSSSPRITDAHEEKRKHRWAVWVALLARVQRLGKQVRLHHRERITALRERRAARLARKYGRRWLEKTRRLQEHGAASVIQRHVRQWMRNRKRKQLRDAAHIIERSLWAFQNQYRLATPVIRYVHMVRHVQDWWRSVHLRILARTEVLDRLLQRVEEQVAAEYRQLHGRRRFVKRASRIMKRPGQHYARLRARDAEQSLTVPKLSRDVRLSLLHALRRRQAQMYAAHHWQYQAAEARERRASITAALRLTDGPAKPEKPTYRPRVPYHMGVTERDLLHILLQGFDSMLEQQQLDDVDYVRMRTVLVRLLEPTHRDATDDRGSPDPEDVKSLFARLIEKADAESVKDPTLAKFIDSVPVYVAHDKVSEYDL